MTAARILAFAGSLRKDSFNKKLVQIAVQGARQAGATVTYIDLKDYPLPIYDGDIEAASGIPENGLKLKKLFAEHDGLLISAPEYNSSISGVLKNAIDWVPRQLPGEARGRQLRGSARRAWSASRVPRRAGRLARGLSSVRAILGNINVIVLL